ncbi:hypothetical protein D3C76_1273660 [compost metagenome]
MKTLGLNPDMIMKKPSNMTNPTIPEAIRFVPPQMLIKRPPAIAPIAPRVVTVAKSCGVAKDNTNG